VRDARRGSIPPASRAGLNGTHAALAPRGSISDDGARVRPNEEVRHALAA
jgi:hypothetical protein